MLELIIALVLSLSTPTTDAAQSATSTKKEKAATTQSEASERPTSAFGGTSTWTNGW